MAAETGTRPRGEEGGGGRQDFGGNGQDGGAGRGGSHHGSWAQVLGSTLPTSHNKNVLEHVMIRIVFRRNREPLCRSFD